MSNVYDESKNNTKQQQKDLHHEVIICDGDSLMIDQDMIEHTLQNNNTTTSSSTSSMMKKKSNSDIVIVDDDFVLIENEWSHSSRLATRTTARDIRYDTEEHVKLEMKRSNKNNSSLGIEAIKEDSLKLHFERQDMNHDNIIKNSSQFDSDDNLMNRFVVSGSELEEVNTIDLVSLEDIGSLLLSGSEMTERHCNNIHNSHKRNMSHIDNVSIETVSSADDIILSEEENDDDDGKKVLISSYVGGDNVVVNQCGDAMHSNRSRSLPLLQNMKTEETKINTLMDNNNLILFDSEEQIDIETTSTSQIQQKMITNKEEYVMNVTNLDTEYMMTNHCVVAGPNAVGEKTTTNSTDAIDEGLIIENKINLSVKVEDDPVHNNNIDDYSLLMNNQSSNIKVNVNNFDYFSKILEHLGGVIMKYISYFIHNVLLPKKESLKENNDKSRRIIISFVIHSIVILSSFWILRYWMFTSSSSNNNGSSSNGSTTSFLPGTYGAPAPIHPNIPPPPSSTMSLSSSLQPPITSSASYNSITASSLGVGVPSSPPYHNVLLDDESLVPTPSHLLSNDVVGTTGYSPLIPTTSTKETPTFSSSDKEVGVDEYYYPNVPCLGTIESSVKVKEVENDHQDKEEDRTKHDVNDIDNQQDYNDPKLRISSKLIDEKLQQQTNQFVDVSSSLLLISTNAEENEISTTSSMFLPSVPVKLTPQVSGVVRQHHHIDEEEKVLIIPSTHNNNNNNNQSPPYPSLSAVVGTNGMIPRHVVKIPSISSSTNNRKPKKEINDKTNIPRHLVQIPSICSSSDNNKPYDIDWIAVQKARRSRYKNISNLNNELSLLLLLNITDSRKTTTTSTIMEQVMIEYDQNSAEFQNNIRYENSTTSFTTTSVDYKNYLLRKKNKATLFLVPAAYLPIKKRIINTNNSQSSKYLNNTSTLLLDDNNELFMMKHQQKATASNTNLKLQYFYDARNVIPLKGDGTISIHSSLFDWTKPNMFRNDSSLSSSIFVECETYRFDCGNSSSSSIISIPNNVTIRSPQQLMIEDHGRGGDVIKKLTHLLPSDVGRSSKIFIMMNKTLVIDFHTIKSIPFSSLLSNDGNGVFPITPSTVHVQRPHPPLAFIITTTNSNNHNRQQHNKNNIWSSTSSTSQRHQGGIPSRNKNNNAKQHDDAMMNPNSDGSTNKPMIPHHPTIDYRLSLSTTLEEPHIPRSSI